MAQADYIVSNGTGAAVRSDLNGQLAAIVTNNSGATSPATTYAYQWWADTTTNTLKLRNSANSAWIEIMQLDGTLTMEDGTAALPGLAFRDDLDTGIFRAGTNQLGISSAGVERVEFGSSEVVFNDSGANYDFRVEGDTNAHLLFVDASADKVGIGTSSVGAPLHVFGSATAASKASQTGVFTVHSASTVQLNIGAENVAPYGVWMQTRDTSGTASNYPIVLNPLGGNIGIGTSSPTHNLTIGTTAASDFVLSLRGGVGGFLGWDDSANCTILQAPNTRSLQFRVNSDTFSAGTMAMHINSSGAVGIGDTGPDSTLTIKAAASVTPLRVSGPSSEFARIDTSGRLLVGTSSARTDLMGAGAQLQVEGTTFATARLGVAMNANNAEGGGIYLVKSRGSSAGGVTVVNSGDVLGDIEFGGADGTNIDTAARIRCVVDGTPGANDMPGSLVFSTTADGASSSTERMRIDSSGRLLLGTTSSISGDTKTLEIVNASTSSTQIYVRHSSAAAGRHWRYGVDSGNTLYVINQDSTGVYINNGSTGWTGLSDERYKDIIEPITGAVEKVASLRAVIGKFKTDEEGRRRAFLIAQDVQTVLPEAVDASNPERLGVTLTDVIPLLVAALKESKERIEALEVKVAALEAQ